MNEINGDRDPWVEFVKRDAQKIGRVFVLDCGEGREMPAPPPELADPEDLSGWLLTPEQAALIAHDTRAQRDAMSARSDLRYCFARWLKTAHGVSISFEAV
jgi:hypothetical protein